MLFMFHVKSNYLSLEIPVLRLATTKLQISTFFLGSEYASLEPRPTTIQFFVYFINEGWSFCLRHDTTKLQTTTFVFVK